MNGNIKVKDIVEIAGMDTYIKVIEFIGGKELEFDNNVAMRDVMERKVLYLNALDGGMLELVVE